MSKFVLGFALLLVCSSFLYVNCLDDDSTRTMVIRRFMDKYQPTLLIRPSARRFRRFDVGNFDIEPEEEQRLMKKRNNAEIVNHILKNYGGIERLGDVGRR